MYGLKPVPFIDSNTIAVVNLGFCLDLVSQNGVQAVESAYNEFCAALFSSGTRMPTNSGGPDLVVRRLDWSVINYLHATRDACGQQPFDTVRGLFPEDDLLYPTSGFRRKTHLQICVRNMETIKGVFRVPQEHFSGLTD